MIFFEIERDNEALESSRPTMRNYRFLKRFLDLTICLAILPFVLPTIILFSIIIILDSPGWPIFSQVRIGKDCKPFCMYKLRTMRIEYDNGMDQKTMKSYIVGEVDHSDKMHSRAIFKPPIEDNITRVGRFLRNTSLDELPQLFNIIKGEMSVVGPRPNVPWEVEAYKDWHYERLEVLPGITGIAQVSGRSSITFDELVSYDLKYVRNQSLRYDLIILLKTIWIVLRREGVG